MPLLVFGTAAVLIDLCSLLLISALGNLKQLGQIPLREEM